MKRRFIEGFMAIKAGVTRVAHSNLVSALYLPKDLNSFLDFKKQMSGAPNDFSVK